ncbi:MAG: hypothetical protein WA916_07390 [Arcobacter sp.]|uniref:hypothetical protein n=1 Tax=Arcobacter sp. TaxID=1872629 RepID=UPI003C76AB55
MTKIEELEKELTFELNKSQIIERKSNIYNKIVFIFLVGYLSLHITNFSSISNETNNKLDKSYISLKEDFEFIREWTIKAPTPEARKENFEHQLKAIEKLQKFNDLKSDYEKDFKSIKSDFFSSVYQILFILIIPFFYFYYKLQTIEKNIFSIQTTIKEEIDHSRIK